MKPGLAGKQVQILFSDYLHGKIPFQRVFPHAKDRRNITLPIAACKVILTAFVVLCIDPNGAQIFVCIHLPAPGKIL